MRNAFITFSVLFLFIAAAGCSKKPGAGGIEVGNGRIEGGNKAFQSRWGFEVEYHPSLTLMSSRDGKRTVITNGAKQQPGPISSVRMTVEAFGRDQRIFNPKGSRADNFAVLKGVAERRYPRMAFIEVIKDGMLAVETNRKNGRVLESWMLVATPSWDLVTFITEAYEENEGVKLILPIPATIKPAAPRFRLAALSVENSQQISRGGMTIKGSLKDRQDFGSQVTACAKFQLDEEVTGWKCGGVIIDGVGGFLLPIEAVPITKVQTQFSLVEFEMRNTEGEEVMRAFYRSDIQELYEMGDEGPDHSEASIFRLNGNVINVQVQFHPPFMNF